MLLSEIYDDVSPGRCAVLLSTVWPVTPRHRGARSVTGNRTPEGLTDCPEDLYLIEGDPQSFDDSVFSVDELEKAVVVKIADRQWRYSRFPEVPLFGRAARESRIESLHAEREVLSERFATLSF